MGTLHVMDRQGDTKLMWDRKNTDEVAAARRTFEDLKKKGFSAYAVKGSGDKGVALTRFDAAEERIIMSPPMAGG